jgi:hypothetical protein
MDLNYDNLCFLTCSIIIFAITFFILIITFIAFSIIGLINTSLEEEYSLCNKSHLCIYSIVSLLLILKMKYTIDVLFKDNSNKNEPSNIIVYIEILINIGIIIWGAYEFYGINCVNNLNNTILYKTTFTYWIFNIILLSLQLVIYLKLISKIFTFYKSNIQVTNDLENNKNVNIIENNNQKNTKYIDLVN